MWLGVSVMGQVCSTLSNLSSPVLRVTLEESHSPHFRDDESEAWGSEIGHSRGYLAVLFKASHVKHTIHGVVQSRAGNTFPAPDTISDVSKDVN